MNFDIAYTKEQEEFRKEVRSWLEENIPDEMKRPVDEMDFTEEQYQFWRKKHKEMAVKGWLNPGYPLEYGGGGLSSDHEAILAEEILRHGFQISEGSMGQLSNHNSLVDMLLVWGTEEQKRKFIPPFMSGEKVSWYKLTEPKSGADLASYQSRAVRDGDDWILSGSNAFISGMGALRPPDFISGPMLTDPDAPRHRNLGYFIIPLPSPGLEIKKMNLVSGTDQHFIFLDNVRVPGDHLIGGDRDGWQVVNTSLERRGKVFSKNEMVENLVDYTIQKSRIHKDADRDPISQQASMDAYIDAEVNTLFNKRAHWMGENSIDMSWEGPLTAYFQRLYGIRNTSRGRDVMEMYALLGTKEHRAPYGGAPEVFQRWSFVLQHGHGSFNIEKVILARRIGISRTKARAAPTPMTANKSKETTVN